MATEREFEGRDLQEALMAAAAATGTAEPELHYEIVEQGRRGVFGLGARSVRIRLVAQLDEESPEPVSPAVPRPARRPSAPPQPSAGAEELVGTLQRMIDLMGLELRAQAATMPGGLEIRLRGADQRLLGQRDGELQSALQFLLNRMARRSWPEIGRIQLGGDGVGGKRDQDLVDMVREVARQVARSGQPKLLQPMNAYERRLVHLTVRELGLASRSQGDGHLKRVTIYRTEG